MALTIDSSTRRVGAVVAFVLTMLAQSGFAQSSVVGGSCDLSVLGVAETSSFRSFDRELRDALVKQDAAATALLVRFPLRVNGRLGSWYVNDSRSLQLRFREIFPVPVRTAVLNQQPDKVSCNYRGIMYGSGTVWVNPQVDKGPTSGTGERYLVEAINLPEASTPVKGPQRGSVEFTCETTKHRVIVDIGTAGQSRYRAWNKPRPLTERPDLEIVKGSKTSEGTGPCSYSLWTFTTGETKFIVQELGCYPDSNQPPKGAKGRLDVEGKTQATWWCY